MSAVTKESKRRTTTVITGRCKFYTVEESRRYAFLSPINDTKILRNGISDKRENGRSCLRILPPLRSWRTVSSKVRQRDACVQTYQTLRLHGNFINVSRLVSEISDRQDKRERPGHSLDPSSERSHTRRKTFCRRSFCIEFPRNLVRFGVSSASGRNKKDSRQQVAGYASRRW